MRPAICFHPLLLLVFPLVVTGGCTHQAMDYSIASWQNKPVAAVIKSWGSPSEELRVNGRHLLLWNTSGNKPVPPVGRGSVQQPGTVGCVRFLEVDRNDRIIAGTWEGNDCPGWFSGWYW